MSWSHKQKKIRAQCPDFLFMKLSVSGRRITLIYNRYGAIFFCLASGTAFCAERIYIGALRYFYTIIGAIPLLGDIIGFEYHLSPAIKNLESVFLYGFAVCPKLIIHAIPVRSKGIGDIYTHEWYHLNRI